MNSVSPPTRPPTNRRKRRCSVELSRSPRLRARCMQAPSRGVLEQRKTLLPRAFPGAERRCGADPSTGLLFAGPHTDRTRLRPETAHAR
jgi:hypothetical protein